MRAMSLRCSVIAVVLGALAGASGARANPLDMYGFGPRGASLAGAVGADVADTSAVYYNPAGLGRLRGLRVDLGYQYAAPTLRTDRRDNGVEATRGILGGIAAPGRVFGLPMAIGIAFHIPDAGLSQSPSPAASQPRWALYGARLQRVYVATALTIAPVRWLRLAAGFALTVGTAGGVAAEGRVSTTHPATSALSHTLDADLTAARYAQLGAQADLGRGVSLGVTYRDAFVMEVGVDASLRGQLVEGPAEDPRSPATPFAYALRARTLTAFQPRQVAMSAAWQINPRWRAGIDLTWSQWSGYEDPSAPRAALRLNDTLTPRFGLSYDAPLGRHAVALRAGYFWDPTPVPAQTDATSLIDSNRHGFSVGVGAVLRRLGAALPGSLSVDAFAALHLLRPRATRKLDPTDPVGDFIASGHVLATGVNLSVGFE